MYTAAALILLPALAAASPLNAGFTPLQRRQSPPADQITIGSVSSSGNGCPQGSVSTTLSDDKTVVTFGFDAFQTYIGPKAAQSDQSKNCQLHLDLKYPGGFQYAVVDATYHGYARLDAGVTGGFLSTYFFSQSAAQTCVTKSSISGAAWLAGDVYTKNDQVETTATIWSPCGDTGILNINNRINLSAQDATESGELSDDDATVAFTHQTHVSWRPCTPDSTPGGGGTFGSGGGSTTITPREAKAEPQAPSFSIVPGGTTTTGSGGSTGGEPGDTWTIGPGGTTVTIGK